MNVPVLTIFHRQSCHLYLNKQISFPFIARYKSYGILQVDIAPLIHAFSNVGPQIRYQNWNSTDQQSEITLGASDPALQPKRVPIPAYVSSTCNSLVGSARWVLGSSEQVPTAHPEIFSWQAWLASGEWRVSPTFWAGIPKLRDFMLGKCSCIAGKLSLSIVGWIAFQRPVHKNKNRMSGNFLDRLLRLGRGSSSTE